jgi:hypothetical protein
MILFKRQIDIFSFIRLLVFSINRMLYLIFFVHDIRYTYTNRKSGEKKEL